MTTKNMTREQLMAVPSRPRFDSPVICNSLVVIPQQDDLHDSGYPVMVVVAALDMVPICKVTECSDAIHFDDDCAPNVDALPGSGCVNFFTRRGNWSIGSALSSLYVNNAGRAALGGK